MTSWAQSSVTCPSSSFFENAGDFNEEDKGRRVISTHALTVR